MVIQEVLQLFREPGGYSLLVKGEPGTGKTIFSLTLLSELCKSGEVKGIYLSTRLDPESLYDMINPEIKKQIRKEDILDATQSEFAEEEGVIRYGDLSDFLREVYERVEKKDVTVLVIDSWDAIHFQISEDDTELIETYVLDVTKKTKTNVIMITERTGTTRLDYLADEILQLEREEIGGRTIRKARIEKMRGIPINNPSYVFTLNNGVFESFEPLKIPHVYGAEKFNPITHTTSHFSSGNECLDEILGGGYQRGSNIFIEAEEGVSLDVLTALSTQTIANWLYQDHGTCMLASVEYSQKSIKTSAFLYGFESKLRLTRFLDGRYEFPSEDFVVEMSGDPAKMWRQEVKNLREETGNPVLHVVGLLTLEHCYRGEELERVVVDEVRSVLNNEELLLWLGCAVSRSNEYLSNLSNVHLKLKNIDGSIALYGVKPRTKIYVLQFDKSYPQFELIPLL